MQNKKLEFLVHDATDREVAEEENSLFMTNVIKRRALRDEVLLVAHTVGRAMAAIGRAMAAKALEARHLAIPSAHNQKHIRAAKPKPQQLTDFAGGS